MRSSRADVCTHVVNFTARVSPYQERSRNVTDPDANYALALTTVPCITYIGNGMTPRGTIRQWTIGPGWAASFGPKSRRGWTNRPMPAPVGCAL
jgi:hypothetical protein